MDEPERDYLREQIRELQRANARWKALALICVGVLALMFLAGGATLLTGGIFTSRRMQMEARRAREAEMEALEQAREAQMQAQERAEEARMQAERARQAERDARRQAEEVAKDAKR